MAEQLNGLLGDSQILAKTYRESSMMDFDTPRSVTEYPFDFRLPNTADLPSQEVAKALCYDALSCACCLLRFIHQPSFYRMFDRIYNIPAKDFGDDENQHLPLLYMMLALGCLFHYGPVDETMLFEYSPYEKRFKQGQVLLLPQSLRTLIYKFPDTGISA